MALSVFIPAKTPTMRRCIVIALFVNAFMVCMVSAQENLQLLRIEDETLIRFHPNGKLETLIRETVTYNLPKKYMLVLDEEFAESLNFRKLKKLQEISREATSKIAEVCRYDSKNADDAAWNLDQWRKYQEMADARFDSNLSASEKNRISCQMEADSFFRLGFKEFVLKRTGKRESEVELPTVTASELRKELRGVELEVVEVLVSDLSEEKQFEITHAISNTIPGRNPTLTVLWQSLLDLEKNSTSTVPDGNSDYYFVVKSGRLTREISIPSNAAKDLVQQIAAVVRSGEAGPHRETILELSAELYQAYEEREDKRNRALEKLKEGFHSQNRASSLQKSLSKDFHEDLEKLSAETIEKLPRGVKEQVLINNLMITFHRYGFERAFFSDAARDRFEFPLDSGDKKKISGNAEKARKLLELRVKELLSSIFKEPLSQHFPPDSISLRWLDQQYAYLAPPVELVPYWLEKE